MALAAGPDNESNEFEWSGASNPAAAQAYFRRLREASWMAGN